MENEEIQQTVNEIKDKFEKRIEEIQSKGSDKINDITDESPDPNSVEATLDVTFDVKWKTTSIKFDVPQFTMKRKDISFDVPSVTMKVKKISWDVPAVKMTRRCLFKKPVVITRGFSVTVKSKCVYGDFPEVYKKRVEIKTDIPEFSMRRQDISFDLPEITFDTTEIKLNLPQFYLKSLSAELKDQENEIQDVSSDMQSEISLAQKELEASLSEGVSSKISKMFDEIEKSLIEERENVEIYYNDAIAKMKSSIKVLKQNNAKDEVVKMETKLNKLIEEYSAILKNIDTNIEDLNKQQEEAMKGIKLG